MYFRIQSKQSLYFRDKTGDPQTQPWGLIDYLWKSNYTPESCLFFFYKNCLYSKCLIKIILVVDVVVVVAAVVDVVVVVVLF